MTAWIPGNLLELETENFRLRSLTAADATDTYVSWWNDPEIRNSLGFQPRGWKRDDAVRHIQKFDNRRNFHLGIFPRDRELPVGFFAVFLEAAGLARTNVVIGDKDFWGRRVVLPGWGFLHYPSMKCTKAIMQSRRAQGQPAFGTIL